MGILKSNPTAPRNGLGLFVLTVCALLALSQSTFAETNQIVDHYKLHEDCANVLNEQVGWEMYASIVYLNMAGYFDKPSVAKPGYARFFRDQSKEEYEHASKIIDYINKRNATLKRISVKDSPKSSWDSPKDALTDALTLENHVFAKIKHIHNVADQKCEDVHLMDYLETNFFSEQVDSMREITEMITKLDYKDQQTGQLVEYFEDRRLLKGSDKEL